MDSQKDQKAMKRLLSGVKLSFVAYSIIRSQILTLDESKYAFNVPHFDFRQVCKITKLMLVLNLLKKLDKWKKTCSLSALLLCDHCALMSRITADITQSQ